MYQHLMLINQHLLLICINRYQHQNLRLLISKTSALTDPPSVRARVRPRQDDGAGAVRQGHLPLQRRPNLGPQRRGQDLRHAWY